MTPQSLLDPDVHVVAVRHHRHVAPLKRPFVTAARRTEAVHYVVAEVELADGTVGQGSSAETVAVTGESAESIAACLAVPLRGALEGARGPLGDLGRRIGEAVPGSTSAKAALDVALHDAAARAARVPLVELLGGTRCGTLTNDMTISLEDPEVMAGHARDAVASGEQILKIKLGRDIDEDRWRLAAVLEAAPGASLRLDANQGWEAREAISIINGFERDGLPIELVEQPVPAADLEGLARVRAEVATPVMADEAVWNAQDARRIVEAGAADLLNIKLAKTGGLREALAVADVALEAGIACMVGSMMEPRISITAAAHLAFAHPAIALIDLDPPAWFTSGAPSGGYRQRGAELELIGGPGLGLAMLDPMQDADDAGGGR
ncbi:dipeptide epimerase [Brachybacterium halotolerans subsp. kimchii]|uniref:dipeptide epimerase n=1 Tax=Brachybacterium halotolerans TaxID=2795215 RepID=UPI001E3E2B27|nr:dipeptide epimerase [Brachybacterium halotolerans]UEJ81756.1 dipeptide epimerase [Brachybacterium halotolerans subsp. kimchii]